MNSGLFTEPEKIEIVSWDSISKQIPVGSNIDIQDYKTSIKFRVRRTAGSLHADVEPCTKEDYSIMKEIYALPPSFEQAYYYPVICTIDGKKYGAAIMSFPHAGSTKTPPGTKTKILTGGFRNILNGNYIRDNGVVGHFCLHFKDSRRHTDEKQDKNAQEAINKIKQ